MHSSGFLDKQTRKRFTTTVVILAALYLVVIAVIPAAIVLGTVFSNMVTMRVYNLSNGIGTPEGVLCSRIGIFDVAGGKPGPSSTLTMLSPDGVHEIARLDGSPHIARYSNTLWCVTRSLVMRRTDGVWQTYTNDTPFPCIGYARATATGLYLVWQDSDDKRCCSLFTGDAWRPVEDDNVPPPLSESYGPDNVRFWYRRGKLSAQVGETGEWVVLGPVSYRRWVPFTISNTLMVLTYGGDGDAETAIWRRGPDGWTATKMASLPRTILGANAMPTNGMVLVATTLIPCGVSWYLFDGTTATRIARTGWSLSSGRLIVSLSVAMQVLGVFAPLLFGLVLTPLMARSKTQEYFSETGEAIFASPARRMAARCVDALIVSVPATIGMFFLGVYGNLISFCEMPFDNFAAPLLFLGGLLLASAYGVLMLIVFSLMEGSYGWTPGKLIFGIRVYGTDLKVCGFWRALLRRIVATVDGFFYYAVGLIAIAFTRNWQRVGDMAARTIVVRRFPQSWIS